MNTNYSIVSPNAAPAQPGGVAGFQSALNSLQTSLDSYNPITKKYATSTAFNPTAVFNPTTNGYNSSTPGTPQWNGTSWVSSATGQPYSGTYFGQTYNNGQSQQQLENNPSTAYQAVNITKSPAINSATNNLIGSFNNGLSLQNNNFSDYLTAANAATQGFNTDINTAYNLGPLSTTLNSLNSSYGTGANNLNNNFAGTTNQLNTNYSNILGNLTGQENADVSQAQAMLPQYDQALTDVGQQEQDALQRQVSRYAAASGTPTGLGSNEEQTLALGTGAIEVPLEQAKIGQEYNILQNMQLPLEQQQAQGQIGQLTGFTLPLAQTQYGQQLNTLNTNYGNAYNTATSLQNLSLQIAGKPIAEAVQYMQSLGVPTEVQQAILSGNVNNLSGLSSLYSGSNYQGLQNVFGNNVATPTGASFNSPGFSPGNTNYSLPTPGAMGIPSMSLGGTGGNPTAPSGPLSPFYNTGYMQDGQGNLWGSNGPGQYYLYQKGNQNTAAAGNYITAGSGGNTNYQVGGDVSDIPQSVSNTA